MIRLATATMLLLITTVVSADGPPSSGGPYTIERYTIDSGGGEAAAGVFGLRGTSGQHDAGALMFGGAYELQGGFWPGVNNPTSTLFNDGLESGIPQ